MRILSLLPSATDIVLALGLGDSLVAVTAECDQSLAPRPLPVVSFPVVAQGSAAGGLSAHEVNDTVTALVEGGEQLYRLDEELIRRLQPELILAQDLCRVCAVPSGDVAVALDRLGCRATVLSLDPTTLDEVIDAVGVVAEAAGVGDRGRALVGELRQRVDAVRRATAGAGRRRVLELEWSDPPYVGGHWVPDMVDAAGADMVLGRPGRPSPRVEWDDIAKARVSVVAFAPCGYGLAEAVTEGAALLSRSELAHAPEIWALDGSALFSRPGPRVVEGVELLGWVLHPDLVPDPPPGRAARLR